MGRDVIPLQKRYLPLTLILLGIAVIFAGFVYDVFFAGIPYQDPTPALQASYEYHSHIASLIRWSGVGVSIIGAMFMVIRRRKGPRTTG
jgi:hypothetical protein